MTAINPIPKFGSVYPVNDNTAIGTPYNAFGTDGGNFGNTAAGYQALQSFVGGAGHNNTAFGQGALTAAVSTVAYTAVGSNAFAEDTNGQFGTGVGSNAGWVCQGGFGNVAMGHGAQGGDDFTPAPNTAGSNTTVGSWSGQELTSGGGNSFFGMSAGLFITTGAHSVGVGSYAMAGGAGGTATAIGNGASYNVAVGEYALQNTTQSFLTAVGWSALVANTTGVQHCAVGYKALMTTVADSNNTAVGANAAQLLNGASNVTAIGSQSQKINVAGIENTTVGSQTMVVATGGNYNTVVGAVAGFKMTTAAGNLILGNRVASTTLTTGTHNILLGIGNQCDTDTASSSDTFRVQGTGTTKTIDANNTNGINPQVRIPGSLQVGMDTFMTTAKGESGSVIMSSASVGASSTAPGATNAKIFFMPGTSAGTAKLCARAGTSNTIFTILDNIGAGVTVV